MSSASRIENFRSRLLGGKGLIGTFVKTPHPSIVEIIGRSSLDCVCIDAEHAPFDRAALDVALLAARAVDLPALVRVPRADAADILNALDLGAAGVVVPHVKTVADAEAVAAACRFGPGGRGYSGSTRAAGYGTSGMSAVIAAGNDRVAAIAQIEDAEALEIVDAIAAVRGLDCLFIGRMDLTVSLGAASPTEPIVVDAVTRVCAAARKAGRAVGMFAPTVDEAVRWLDAGASLFLLESDQQWLSAGADALARRFRSR